MCMSSVAKSCGNFNLTAAFAVETGRTYRKSELCKRLLWLYIFRRYCKFNVNKTPVLVTSILFTLIDFK